MECKSVPGMVSREPPTLFQTRPDCMPGNPEVIPSHFCVVMHGASIPYGTVALINSCFQICQIVSYEDT